VSDFAPEYGDWPAEADAVAGNLDHLDVDGEPDYGYDSPDDQLPWQPIDTDSPEFRELARQYALEEAHAAVSQLVENHLAPLGAQMEVALEQQDFAAGMDQVYDALEGFGVAEDDRQAVFEITAENLEQAAAQIGVDVPTFLQAMEEAYGLGDGSGAAAALAALEIGAASMARAHEHANAKDEFAVYDLHFRQPLYTERGPTTLEQPSTPGDEFGVLRKWFPNG
jgi:hypothetical protein